jgi:hypothetical protein
MKYIKDTPLITKSQVIQLLDAQGYNSTVTRVILRLLIHKGFLFEVPPSDVVYLSDKGWLYEGYAKVMADEQRKAELEDALLDSGVKANKSSSRVNNLFWVTLAVAVAGVVAQALAFFNDREKYDLQQRLESKDTLIQSLQKQLLQTKSVQPQRITVIDSSTKK